MAPNAARTISCKAWNSPVEYISTLSKKIDLVHTESDEKDKRTKNLIFRGVPKSDTCSDLDLVKSILKDIEYPNIVVENFTRLKISNHVDSSQSTSDTHLDVASANGTTVSESEGAVGNDAASVEGDTNADSKTSKETSVFLGTRHNPIKVIFSSIDDRTTVLKSAHKIKKNKDSSLYDAGKVFIVPNMTKLERQQDFQLRMALKVKKKSHPDRPWIIKGGHFSTTQHHYQ